MSQARLTDRFVFLANHYHQRALRYVRLQHKPPNAFEYFDLIPAWASLFDFVKHHGSVETCDLMYELKEATQTNNRADFHKNSREVYRKMLADLQSNWKK